MFFVLHYYFYNIGLESELVWIQGEGPHTGLGAQPMHQRVDAQRRPTSGLWWKGEHGGVSGEGACWRLVESSRPPDAIVGNTWGKGIYIAGPVHEPSAQLMCWRWPGPGWHEREWASAGMSVTQMRGSGASRRGLARMHEKHEGGGEGGASVRAQAPYLVTPPPMTTLTCHATLHLLAASIQAARCHEVHCSITEAIPATATDCGQLTVIKLHFMRMMRTAGGLFGLEIWTGGSAAAIDPISARLSAPLQCGFQGRITTESRRNLSSAREARPVLWRQEAAATVRTASIRVTGQAQRAANNSAAHRVVAAWMPEELHRGEDVSAHRTDATRWTGKAEVTHAELVRKQGCTRTGGSAAGAIQPQERMCITDAMMNRRTTHRHQITAHADEARNGCAVSSASGIATTAASMSARPSAGGADSRDGGTPAKGKRERRTRNAYVCTTVNGELMLRAQTRPRRHACSARTIRAHLLMFTRTPIAFRDGSRADEFEACLRTKRTILDTPETKENVEVGAAVCCRMITPERDSPLYMSRPRSSSRHIVVPNTRRSWSSGWASPLLEPGALRDALDDHSKSSMRVVVPPRARPIIICDATATLTLGRERVRKDGWTAGRRG
ncbi:hypothetical protein B0H21DRAFT_711236 [Amylocystis lapponica]|nr:hypothetical protein B0H21DRAFT_711236 [Amylocystis lapponica]